MGNRIRLGVAEDRSMGVKECVSVVIGVTLDGGLSVRAWGRVIVHMHM